MTRQSDVELIEAQLARALEREPDVVAAFLFGSHARAEAEPESDVDVGVLFREKPGLRDVVQLEARLERALGRDVDLVDAGSAGAFLALDIINGRRILCTDEYACDRFELYVLRRAGDLAPFERARREALLEVR